MAAQQFTAADNGRAVSVAPGEAFVLALDENPTTGYRWEISANAAVVVVSSDYQPGGGGAGAAGVHTFVLRADKPGAFALTARLMRSWLGPSSATQTCELTINAQ